MINNSIDFSIIIPIYNLQDYIVECLESILIQKDATFEIICIDDASTDNSLNILLEYQRNDSRIKVFLNKTNQGPATSRNNGLRQACGKYIYYLDGDDCLKENALKKMLNLMNEKDLDFLGFSSEIFYDDEQLKMECEFDKDEYIRHNCCGEVLDGPEMFSLLYDNHERACANLCLYCFRNDFIKGKGLYDIEGLRYADDNLFIKYMNANRVMCIKEVLHRRRYRRGSTVMGPAKKVYLESEIVLLADEFACWQKQRLTKKQNTSVFNYFMDRMQEIDCFLYKFKKEKSEMTFLKEHYSAFFLYKSMFENALLYECLLSEQQKKMILLADKLIIYGAGYYAEKITDILEHYGKNDYVVVVSNKNKTLELKKHKVYELKQVKSKCTNAIVIVAMSKKNKNTIDKEILKLKAKEIIWFGK